MPTNDRLAALMTEAGFLDRSGAIGRKRFARAVGNAPAAREAGRSYTHTYVSRWINGTVPRDDATRNAIREALGQQLGRVIALDEIGFGGGRAVSTDVGLGFPDEPDAGVGTVTQLLDADLTAPDVLSRAPTVASAWNDASMAWLVGSQRPISAESPAPSRVGPPDVARLRSMRDTFDHLDSTYGGAHARKALVQYLRTELPKLLRAQGTTVVREALFTAGGELTQLAAWMSYDAGLHGLAQRYFIQALALADAGRDRLLSASILDAMSHQASFLGRYREAANMARAARLGTERCAVPILTSHFYVMEARALARAGDDPEAAARAMGAAVEHFDRHTPGEGPAWIGYFDEAELAAELGHCYRDLSQSEKSVLHAEKALSSATGDYLRSDFFAAMVLADAHLDRGDVDEGCRVAARAFAAGEDLDSARCRSYVDEFRRRLIPHRRNVEVRTFVTTVRDNRLWTPPSANAS